MIASRSQSPERMAKGLSKTDLYHNTSSKVIESPSHELNYDPSYPKYPKFSNHQLTSGIPSQVQF
jgi:hypothetical protein